MALKNMTDTVQAAQQLATAIERRLGVSAVQVTSVTIPQSSGLSNETILFDAAWTDADGSAHSEQLVARVEPSGPAVFPRYDLGLEFRVMQALDAGTDVAVPRMLFHEDDTELLGAPFIVMARVDGRIPSDDPPFTATGWVLEDLDAQQRAQLCDNALQALVAIHAVDLDAVGLTDLRDHAEAGLEGQLRFWEETFTWAADGDANPTVEAGFAWLREHQPTTEATVLNWGDARIGNMIFRDDLSVGAVLDWEMVAVADPALDVAWWLFMQRHHTEGIGMPLPEGFPSRDEVVARYEELSGRTLEHLDFYEVFVATRLSALMHRAGNLMIQAGLLPPEAPMKFNNPASQLLAKTLGLPAPEGASQSFIGNR
jgi:aminoglycoside phosphotransferase (APT) family kinase protein